MLMRLLVTGGILVANGVLLVLVLRVLTLVVIRRVNPAAAPAAEPYTRVVRSQTAPAATVVEPRPAPGGPPPLPAVGSAPVAAARGPAPPDRPRNRYRIHHHRMLLGVPALAAIFAAGAWLGDWVGNGGSTAAAATQTVRLKGKIIYTPGSTVQVQVPGTTLTISGKVVTVPSTVIIPGASGVSVETLSVPTTIDHRVTVPTTITTTISVPPTTVTQTDTSTVSVTETVTDTTTVTQTDTTTVSQTATT